MYIVTQQIVRYKQGDITYTVAQLECDTISDLPLPTGNEQPGVGSKAHVVSDNSVWAYKSTGQWVLQNPDGTAGYTKEEIDQLIQDTKDYADGEILGAINDLDVPSIGGTTRYIYLVGQADGKVTASYYNSDTTPTAGSTKLVQSGGVKTYVDNAVATKASITDIYGPGISIPDGADLNDDAYKLPGVYYRKSTSTTEYITNTPVTSNYFKVIVEWVYPDYRLRQTFISLNRSCTYYMRVYDSGGWQAWHIFKNSEDTVLDVLGQGTQLSPTSANHIDLNDYLTADKVGVYYTSNSTATGNLDNCPYSGASIRLEITKTGGYINQTIYVNIPSNQKIYRRTAVIGGTIGNWFVFEGTEVQPQSLQSISPQVMSVNLVNPINEVDEVTDEDEER